MSDTYRAVYDAAIKELTELTNESESLSERLDHVAKRIVEVKKGALALAPLCDQSPWMTHPHLFPELTRLSSWGLTDSIRKVLSAPPADWMSPVAIRDGLAGVGYKGKSKSLLPSVHTTLKRLIDAGEVETDNRDGRTWYRWLETPLSTGRPLADSLRDYARSTAKGGKAKTLKQIMFDAKKK